MPADLSGVDMKIERAYRHLAELDGAIEAAFNTSGERFCRKFDPQTKNHVYRVHSLPAIDPQWSLITGEVLYNLRSALDHLAWQLVSLDGGTPGEQTYFPVRKSALNKKGQFIPTDLTPPVKDAKLLATLEECQPYKGPEGEAADYRDSPLWQLHDLNIVDKHRLLLVVVCVLDIDQMYWGSDPDMVVPRLKVAVGPLKENSPVAWFDFHGAEPPVDFNPHLALAVSLDEPTTLDSRLTPISLIDVLRGMSAQVEWVLGQFRPLFG